MAIYDFFVSRNGAVSNTANYVGHAGRLFYDSSNGVIRLSDGATPGGLSIPYTIATETIVGGIKAGPGANVSLDGTLTIDTAGLPLSFGDFTANVNILTTVNANEDMVLATNGDAEVQLVGNVGFYRPNGLPPQEDHRFFFANKDGQIKISVPASDPTAGAVEIIGSTSGFAYPPVNSGVILHLTGNNGDASRFYNDGIGSFAAFVGRRLNGSVISPTAVKAGDEIIRISSTGYNGTTIPGSGSARIVYQAVEDYTATNFGSNISLWTCAVGSNVLSKIVTVDSASGLTATKATVQGNLTVNGNIVGNASTTVATIGTANITVLNVSNSSTFGGNIRYDVSVNNATVTQLTSKTTPVTCNGRTGQITTSSASIAKGEAVTFTVNNSYVTAATDVPVVVIQSGATPNSYAIAVTRVQPGNFNITITNNGVGALSDTIIINFALIRVG